MLATIKSGEAAARRDCGSRLVTERLTDQPQEDGYINSGHAARHRVGAEALAAYEVATGNVVRQTGFLAHTELMAGCSLDGDMEDMPGIVEVKMSEVGDTSQLLAPRCGAVESQAADLAQPVDERRAVAGLRVAAMTDSLSRCNCSSSGCARNDFEIAAYERTVRAFLDSVDAEYAAVLGLLPAAV